MRTRVRTSFVDTNSLRYISRQLNKNCVCRPRTTTYIHIRENYNIDELYRILIKQSSNMSSIIGNIYFLITLNLCRRPTYESKIR